MIKFIIDLLKKLFKIKDSVKKEDQKTEETIVKAPKPEPIKSLWYPKATIPNNKMLGSGTYEHGYPEGAIVHFTAGQDTKESDALDSYEWGRDQGYVYFVIAPSGKVYQGFPLNVRGAHAGTSSWSGLGDSVSKYLVGIEICCAGKLEKISDDEYISWFKRKYKASEVRFVSEEKYGCPTGYYKKFTENQENSLIELLKWLKENNPDVFKYDYVLGHHEVAGKLGIGYWRKNDPGGSLSITMPELRKLLKDN